MTYYTLKLNYNNGYKCGCCRRTWDNEINLFIDFSFEERQDYKKSNHDISKLRDSVYEKMCQEIQVCGSSSELDYSDYSIIYTYYNEDVESEVDLIWETPFDFQNELEQFEKDFLNKKNKTEKKNRITSLKRELSELLKE